MRPSGSRNSVLTITPKPEFYKLYDQRQISNIISNLDIHHEIPLEYAYFARGADDWDEYIQRLATETVPNFLTSTIEQLRANQGYIDDLTFRYTRVNVIDVGPGNGLPVRGLLQHLLDQGKMGRYVALDISSAMLQVVKRNIQDWFGSRVPFEGHEVDITYDTFAHLQTEEDAISIFLAFGGGISNMRSPDDAFKTIHNSMNRQDLLIYHLKLDSERTRQYFNLGIRAKSTPLDDHKKMVVDLLNIDESFYDVEVGYDDKQRERYMRLRLKVAMTITFDLEKGKRTVVFNKNDSILVWRYWHQSAPEVVRQLDHNNFDVLQTSITEDKDYLLTVSRVKSER